MYAILMCNLKTSYIHKERKTVGVVAHSEHEEGADWVHRSFFCCISVFLSLFSDSSLTFAAMLSSDFSSACHGLKAKCKDFKCVPLCSISLKKFHRNFQHTFLLNFSSCFPHLPFSTHFCWLPHLCMLRLH